MAIEYRVAGGQLDRLPALAADLVASVKHGVDVLIIAADPFFDSQRERIVALATRHGVAALYAWRE